MASDSKDVLRVGAAASWGRWLENAEPVVAAGLYAAIISAVTRWWTVYQFNPDEGVNLMKAALAAEGFKLYSEIWNDQPPVFTLILIPLQWLFPASVNAARAVVLAFAALMVFSLFRIVRRADGRSAAWLAVLALAGERMFAVTSVGVLIGLPAIALALAGLDQALAGAKSETRLRFIAAGILLGLALQTKMFVALMLPAVAMAPFVARWSSSNARRSATVNLATLAGATVATFAIIAVIFSEPIFVQLLSPHSTAAGSAAYAELGGFQRIVETLSPQLLLFVAAIGVVAFVWHRRLVHAIPVIWLVVAGVGLSFHRPFWAHQAVLLQLPIAWLGGQALAAFEPLHIRRWISVGGAVCVLWLSGTTLYDLTTTERAGRRSLESPLLTKGGKAGVWVVADNPIDAYRANLLVPPEVAVLTEKRLVTGNLTGLGVVDIIQRYSPEELLFRRFRPTPSFIQAIQYGFRPASNGKGYLHAVRRNPR